ncbi:MAG: ABC transporter permease subunit [Synechococcaceae cyanobacterium RL_1_2]|nr:ABC transporter permease subunit [Synechococcaceae cyanobacterium RL_1_2]
MNAVIAIFRKELLSYFLSPFAYAIAAVFWLMSGFFFVIILFGLIQDVAMGEQMGLLPQSVDVATQFIQGFWGLMGSLVLFILPLLSMGLYAREKQLGTLELLATSPLSHWSIAVGKLLGVLVFFITLTMPFLLLEAIVLSATTPALGPALPLIAHCGIILLGAAILSLGMFISSLTDNTIIAAMMTFGLVLMLWVIDTIAENNDGILGTILNHLSLLRHYNNLLRGLIDTGSVAMLISYIVLGVFLTTQSMEALRFQRN